MALDIDYSDLKQEEKFEVFTIPPMSSRSLLGGALHISCFEKGMTVQARLCQGDDFDGIAKELWQKKAVKNQLKLSCSILHPGHVGPCCRR